jgi:DNA replication and repair protein RecF
LHVWPQAASFAPLAASCRLPDVRSACELSENCDPLDLSFQPPRPAMSAGPPEPAPAAVTRLKLRHFRCFEQCETEFAPGANFIIGPNARGKTSILEGICILLRLQSPRVTTLARVIQHERRGFVADGYFGSRHLQFYYSRERKKLALDGVEQTGAREWLKIARVMWFGNEDIEIVRGAAEQRRRFLDFVAGQREAGYLATLRAYQHALRSRNHLLKQPSLKWREIAAFDGPLLEHGVALMQARRELVAALQAESETRAFGDQRPAGNPRARIHPGGRGGFPRGLGGGARGRCALEANHDGSPPGRRAVLTQRATQR